MARRKTNKEFLLELDKLEDGSEYLVLDNYVKSDVKIRFKHLVCGNTFKMRPDCFLRGQRCPACARERSRDVRFINNRRKFSSKFKIRSKGEYECLGSFKGATVKIKFKHLVCGHIFNMSPHHFIDDHAGCPFCFGTPRKTMDEFKRQVHAKFNNQYTILSSSYISTEDHVLCRCNKCGNQWKITPANLLRGYGCPVCHSSKGERFIRGVLLNNNISFEFAKTFDTLIDKSNLRYDFYLPDYNLLIEYQGKQHYQPVNFHGALSEDQQYSNYKRQQYHDWLKYNFAIKNNYSLLYIPYWVNTYEDISKLILDKVENSK